MRFKFSIGLGVALAALATAAPAMADVDPNGYTATKQPQIGTCGNEWATATITRTWEGPAQKSDRDVWRVYYSGGFQTRDGSLTSFPSPGACLPPIGTWTPGVSLGSGIHGRIEGFETIKVSHPGGRTFNPLGVCQAPCTSAQLLAAFYPPGTTLFGHGPGGGVRFHFSKVSPYLPLLCASNMYVDYDLQGFTMGAGYANGDIATTC
jgi:hypothetical protein